MPNIKSAKKRVLVAERNRLRNKRIKSGVRTIIKRFDEAIEAGEFDNAKVLYPKVVKSIDMAVSKGTLHKNAASRQKSKLSLKLNAAQSN